jgi:transposase
VAAPAPSSTHRGEAGVIDLETLARIRQLYYGEHWRVGTIAAELGLHHGTVERVLRDQTQAKSAPRPSRFDPYVDFTRELLERYPRLRATRLWQMLRERGCTLSVRQVRDKVRQLRPAPREAFLVRRVFPAEEAQVDWASFGHVTIGAARRALSAFVLTLTYSRWIFLRFFLDQSLENFLRGHVYAFADLRGGLRHLIYDNLRSAVAQRHGAAVRFNPRLLELASHYHFAPRACAPARGSEKGAVERSVRYIRDSFFAARSFTTIDDLNRQALAWRDEIAGARRWVSDDRKSVAEAFREEAAHLLPLPEHPFETDLVIPVRSEKTIYVRFDLNDYSIPPEAVGRPLTLVASERSVRVLEGVAELAAPLTQLRSPPQSRGPRARRGAARHQAAGARVDGQCPTDRRRPQGRGAPRSLLQAGRECLRGHPEAAAPARRLRSGGAACRGGRSPDPGNTPRRLDRLPARQAPARGAAPDHGHGRSLTPPRPQGPLRQTPLPGDLR